MGQLKSQLWALVSRGLAPVTALSLAPQLLQPWSPTFPPLEQVSHCLQPVCVRGIDRSPC